MIFPDQLRAFLRVLGGYNCRTHAQKPLRGLGHEHVAFGQLARRIAGRGCWCAVAVIVAFVGDHRRRKQSTCEKDHEQHLGRMLDVIELTKLSPWRCCRLSSAADTSGTERAKRARTRGRRRGPRRPQSAGSAISCFPRRQRRRFGLGGGRHIEHAAQEIRGRHSR